MVAVPGSGSELNQALEYAGRVGDFMEFAELMCRDALERSESCGCHFREEFQTADGEARRNDADFCPRGGLGISGGSAGGAAQGAAQLCHGALSAAKLQMSESVTR